MFHALPTSKNIFSKIILRYHVSTLTLPSRVFQNSLRAVNPLSQLDINRKFVKYISISVYHCRRGYLMNSLIIEYNNDEGCHFVVRIRSPALLSFCIMCVVFFSFFLILICFVESTTSCGVEVNLSLFEIERFRGVVCFTLFSN